MNLDSYEKEYFSIYEAFAETVHFILKKALSANRDLPQPQSIQSRAKGIDSLRRRLNEVGKLETQTLESDRRDLAGVRLIFYTNNDVDRILASPLIRENFEIEEDSTKIHHPLPENGETQYRAIHYTIRLSENRVHLPEYARFAGLRCEIQIQTILNHAWSETSHDILYKNPLGNGYGSEVSKEIKRKLDRVMREHLLIAGFEMQKIQQDHERLLQGKKLFDEDIIKLLDNAQNNNERYKILSDLKDYAIPHYDNLSIAYEELKAPLLRAVNMARSTETVPIETTYGKMEGFKTEAVTKLVVEIIRDLRYVDIVGTLQLLSDIYRAEPNDKIRLQILNVAKNLSSYKIGIYNQVGFLPQQELIDHLAGMSDTEVDRIRPIALAIWTQVLQLDITGEKWKADSVILSTGAVPISDQLKEIRDKTVTALFATYDRSTDDEQKREVLSALYADPYQRKRFNESLITTLKDTKRIVDFVSERSKNTSYELLQFLEHRFFYDFILAKGLISNSENQANYQIEAEALVAAIFKFRDIINTDDLFIRYKVLMGFQSIFSAHWANEKFDYTVTDEYRRGEIDGYIDEINVTNEDNWFNLITRCSETKSNDLATFSVFGNFISKLAERKPEVAARFLTKSSDNLRNFLTCFLNGLALSDQHDIYERVLESELESARNLTDIARHLRYSDVENSNFAARLLEQSIDKNDSTAITQCLLFALEHYGTEKIPDTNILLSKALSFLNDNKDARWVSEAWFLQKTTKFYEMLTSETMAQILQNMSYLCHVDYQVEAVLVRIAEHHLEAVWDYFGTRLTRKIDESEAHFEAIPFEFHNLQKEFLKNPQLAIGKGFSWFQKDPDKFRYSGGGRLFSLAFPKCPPEFTDALAELVKSGGSAEADFALAILQNYHDEISTYTVLKEIVSQFPYDSHKMGLVGISINNTGVVSGELGFVKAWRAKKESLQEWLADERSMVKVFAQKHITELDLMIEQGQLRAETEREMRNRSYEDEEKGV